MLSKAIPKDKIAGGYVFFKQQYVPIAMLLTNQTGQQAII